MARSPLKDTTQPVDSEEEGRSSIMDRRWLIEKTSNSEVSFFCICKNVGEREEKLSSFSMSAVLQPGTKLTLYTCTYRGMKV